LTDTNTPEEIDADAKVDVTFRELGLDPKILKALDDLGYVTPTPIQAKAIPAALKQRDVLGIAQTGTGKTGAFTLPTMHKLAKGRARARMPRCLIICPTRELAAQVAEDVENYGKYLKLSMALLIGGVSFKEQDQKLTKGVDILIATPGRLLDQFERGKILMTGVQTLIVDEADRMLDMGFIPDIERIFAMTPFTRQVLFFSATMPNEIKRLVDQFLHQPVSIQIARKNMTAKTVTQRIIRMPSSDPKVKRTTIRWLIERENVDNGIIFCNRKRDVDIVAKSLNKHGHDAAPIHGDLAQSLRTETLNKFRNGEIKYLVASDVAARGLDVPTVSHVFNYDVPNHSEDYVHRIGRTGRAGRKGDAIMLVARLDEKNYDDILRLIKVEEIEEIDVPGIEDFPKDGGGRKRKGGRRDGGGRGRRDHGGRNRGQRDDGSYHDGISSTETVSKGRRKAPAKAKAKAKEADAPRETTEEAAKAKPARKPAEKRRPAPRRRPAPGRKSEKPEAKAAEAPEPTPSEKPKRERSSSRRRAAPPGRKKAAPAKAEPKTEAPAKPERKRAAPKPERSKSEDKPARKSRAKAKPKQSKDDKTPFGDDVPDFLKF
jgi:superfamily II DNA/RNA helicase